MDTSRPPRRPPPKLVYFSLLLSGLDYAKQAVVFIGDASSEVEVVIDEEEPPQPIDCQYSGGFVEMPESQAAKAAIQGLNGKELEGRALTVNEAKPREPRRETSRSRW